MDDFSSNNGGRRVYRPRNNQGTTTTVGSTSNSGNYDRDRPDRNGNVALDDTGPRRRGNFERKQRVQDDAALALSGGMGLSEAEKESLEVMRAAAPKVRRVEKKAEAVEPVTVSGEGPLLTHLKQLRQMSTDELFQLAEELNVKDSANFRRHEMMFRIVEAIPKDI